MQLLSEIPKKRKNTISPYRCVVSSQHFRPIGTEHLPHVQRHHTQNQSPNSANLTKY